MKESTTYQAILREGENNGSLKEARKLLLRLASKHLGPPDTAANSVIEGMTDLDRLERMAERASEVTTWSELLATL